MGVNLIIKGADFSRNGFHIIPIDFQELKSITSLYYDSSAARAKDKTYSFNTGKFVLDNAWEITFIGEYSQKLFNYQHVFADYVDETTPVIRVIFGLLDSNNLIVNYNYAADRSNNVQYNFVARELYTIKLNSQNVSINNETNALIYSQQTAVEKTVPISVYLFGFKIHNFNMTHNGEVVLDYVPVRRKSDNALGFYDMIAEEFLELDNTKQLVAEEL